MDICREDHAQLRQPDVGRTDQGDFPCVSLIGGRQIGQKALCRSICGIVGPLLHCM